MSITHISFHDIGLSDLPTAKQKDLRHVARLVAEAGCYSVFDATATKALAKTMDAIDRKEWFSYDTKTPYPWVKVTLTDAGRKALGLS